MRAAYLTGIEQMEIREAARPAVENPDDVLLQVETVGVCGSDIHYYRTGRIGDQVVDFPFVVGHECSGRVVEVGPVAADRISVGQRIAVDPLMTCGECDQCRSGRPHTCRNQRFLGCPGQAEGALKEFLVMPAESCWPVPDELTPTQTALLEPLAIGVYAAQLAGDVAGGSVAVLGSGPIGLCTLLSLKAAGDCKVYATDLLDERLAVARACGADWTGNAGTCDVQAEIAAAEPPGVDVVVECAGEQETLDQGVELLRPGGTLLMVGIPELDRVSFNPSRMRRKELTLQNVRRQNFCQQAAIDLVASGAVDVTPLATHEFDFEHTKDAFNLVEHYRDGVVKAMIHLT